MDKGYKEKSLNALYITHVNVLLAGLLAGLLSAYHILNLDFNFTAELKLSKELGIVSYTTMNNYAKSRDILAYMALTGLPILSAVGAWLIWARRKQRATLSILFPAEGKNLPAKNRDWRLFLTCIAGVYLVCSWNINFFYQQSGLWEFLGEEGEILAWAQAILTGNVYGKDFFCLYGPLLVYPLAWAMELFDVTVITERAYALCLNLGAYGIIIYFLYTTCRGRLTFIMASCIYLLAFSPLVYRSPNCSYLRVALGMLPLLCAYQYQHSGRKALLAASGGIIGLSLLFSQEVGICSGLALVSCIALHAAAQRDYKSLPGRLLLIAGGGLTTLMPMLLYLSVKGALGPVFSMLYEYPKLVSLGYGSLPAPSFAAFLAAPLTEGPLLYYGIIGIYICTAVFLIPLLLMGRLTRDYILTAGLIVFGALLFRSALGRSDQYHVYYASQPAFLLLFLTIDRAAAGIRGKLPGLVKAGNSLLVVGLLIFLRLLFVDSYNLRNSFDSVRDDLKNFSRKWTRIRSGTEVPDLTRAGVLFDPATAKTLEKIRSFLDAHTAPGDYVYFFPNEAAYYFLFDRTNPTRYAIASFAATSEHRRELVADLEKNKPRYIFYPVYTWRIDTIPDDQLLPEVVRYLRQSYKQHLDIGEFLILKRMHEL
ncbi:MAG: hypothetical protein JW832_08495 [Deltaproteobacteria bacterium]|nr:hypothetical protein [Deltaproteobacteria bacterium]